MRMHRVILAKTIFVILLLISLAFSATISGLILKSSMETENLLLLGILTPLAVLILPIILLYVNAFFMGVIVKIKKRNPLMLQTESLNLCDVGILFSVYNSLHQLTFSITRLLEPVIQGYLRNFLYRLMGAKIGKNVKMNGLLVEPDFITIGDNTIIGHKTLITGHIVNKDKTYLNNVVIGKNCLIGGFSIIAPGVIIEDDVTVGALSIVPQSKKIKKSMVYLSASGRIIPKRIRKH